MATFFAYFADLPDGTCLEWRDSTERRPYPQRSRMIPARVVHRDGATFGWTESGYVRVTRRVELKATPSRHQCDSRCMHATGRTMKCECACGGRNHGRGSFACEAA